MIDDLFSHKIHASDLELWKRNLVRQAAIYLELDNRTYNDKQFNIALRLLSPNAARTPSRDIYSIYRSILGIGHIVWNQEEWEFRISETARRYLIGSEPNVEAFCRLQLSLYQRPDGRGQMYHRSGVRLEHQSQNMTRTLIDSNYRVCPLRLILKIVEAKSSLLGQLQDSIFVTPEEIYTLANYQEIRCLVSAPISLLSEALRKYYTGELPQAPVARKSFSFLEATGLVEVERSSNNLRLYSYGDVDLNQRRNLQIESIKSLPYFFEEFHHCGNNNEVASLIKTGAWANYFDACNTLSEKEVQEIAGEIIISTTFPLSRTSVQSKTSLQPSLLTQPRRIERGSRQNSTQRRQTQTADPVLTQILRERRNAWHDLLVQKMSECLEKVGLEPLETELIDVLAHLDSIKRIYPNGFPIQNTYLDGQYLPYFSCENSESLTFVFEMKSSDKSIIVDQVRKAVSQLYEYRYRYRYYSEEPIRENTVLVIVLQQSPDEPSWLKEYLLFDRRIAVCWLREDQSKFDCFDECKPILEPLITC